MSRVNNTIDKFGRHRTTVCDKVPRGVPGIGFKLTPDQHFDIQGKSLRNVAEPSNDNDVATKQYVLKQVYELGAQISSIFSNVLIPMIHKMLPEDKDGQMKKLSEEVYEFRKYGPLLTTTKIKHLEKSSISKTKKIK